jgi:LacI family transcriptional regulator
VALVGFDDLPLASFTQPPLTTIKQPVEEIGAAAARQLLAQMCGEPWDEPPVLPTILVRRQSA